MLSRGVFPFDKSLWISGASSAAYWAMAPGFRMRIPKESQKPLPIIGSQTKRAYSQRMKTKHHQSRTRRRYCDPSWTAPQRLAFWTKPDPLSGCLIWQGSVWNGYGRIQYGGRTLRAHRWAWTIRHGPIRRGMVVCHRCDERRCVNADHLFLAPQAGNLADMKRKWRARRSFGSRNYKTPGGLPADAHPAEIAPIRIVCDRFELLGDVVLRPLDPSVKPIIPSPAPAAGRAPRARRGDRSSRTGACHR